jgi:hypothetical protein
MNRTGFEMTATSGVSVATGAELSPTGSLDSSIAMVILLLRLALVRPLEVLVTSPAAVIYDERD